MVGPPQFGDTAFEVSDDDLELPTDYEDAHCAKRCGQCAEQLASRGQAVADLNAVLSNEADPDKYIFLMMRNDMMKDTDPELKTGRSNVRRHSVESASPGGLGSTCSQMSFVQDGTIPLQSSINDRRSWSFCGATVCGPMYRHRLHLSQRKFAGFKQRILAGCLEPKADMRQGPAPTVRDTAQQDHADAWLNWLYTHIAEGLAECDYQHADQQDEGENEHVPSTESVVESCVLDPSARTTRYLAPGRIQELYEFYGATSQGSFASHTTFGRVFRDKWRGALTFRKVSQHATCTTCLELTKSRGLARTSELKALADERLRQHISGMYKDRVVYRRMQMLSVESTKFDGGLQSAQDDASVLTLTIDGMDQVIIDHVYCP